MQVGQSYVSLKEFTVAVCSVFCSIVCTCKRSCIFSVRLYRPASTLVLFGRLFFLYSPHDAVQVPFTIWFTTVRFQIISLLSSLLSSYLFGRPFSNPIEIRV